MSCPSCDRDLSYPGAPGHECYTYEERRLNIALRELFKRDAERQLRQQFPEFKRLS